MKKRVLGVIVAGVSLIASGLTVPAAANAGPAPQFPGLVESRFAVQVDGELRIDGKAVAEAAARIPIVDSSPVGYSRDLFPHWEDPDGNGCDARNDVLTRDLQAVVVDGSCRVQQGVLKDPYTGHTINFTRGASTSSEVQIDHVVALSTAYTGGAHLWSEEGRREFANDTRNLLAVAGGVNQRKGHFGPSEWMPPNAAFACTYVALYTDTLVRWGIAVTETDRSALVTKASSPECANAALGSATPDTASMPASDPDSAVDLDPFVLPGRLAGNNRFDTAAVIASKFNNPETVFIATGANYADALAAGPAAAKLGAPILLTRPDVLPRESSSALESLRPKRVVVIGGAPAVGSVVEETVRGILPSATVERVAGSNRHQTAQQIAKRFFSDSTTALVATGWNFPDALSASAAAAKHGYPILLGTNNALTEPTSAYLQTSRISNVVLVGSSKALAPNGEYEAQQAGVRNVSRVGGRDRFETSVAVMDRFFPDARQILIAKSYDWPDGLVAAPLSRANSAPLLLSLPSCSGGSVPNRVSKVLQTGGSIHFIGHGVTTAAPSTVCPPPAKKPPAQKPPAHKPPAQKPPAKKPPAKKPPASVEYKNCKDVWQRLGRPIKRTEPGFRPKFDADGDGTGCERRPRY